LRRIVSGKRTRLEAARMPASKRGGGRGRKAIALKRRRMKEKSRPEEEMILLAESGLPLVWKVTCRTISEALL